MQDIIIYCGIAINIVDALFLMAYGMKYAYAFHKSRNDSIWTEALKQKWAKMKSIGFVLILVGSLIAIIGCAI